MPNQEVLKLLAHLVVTLFLIVAYVVILFFKGEHDPMLSNVLVLAVGYWFGAVPLALSGKGNDNAK